MNRGIPQSECGLDEPGVGERLGKVADVRVRGGVHLLGIETERCRKLHELSEAIRRLGNPTALRKCLHAQNAHGRNAPSVPGRPSRPGG